MRASSTWVSFRVAGDIDPRTVPREILSTILERLPQAVAAGCAVGPGKGCPAAFGVKTTAGKYVTVLVSHSGDEETPLEWAVGYWEDDLAWLSRHFGLRRSRAPLTMPQVSAAVMAALRSNGLVTVIAVGEE